MFFSRSEEEMSSVPPGMNIREGFLRRSFCFAILKRMSRFGGEGSRNVIFWDWLEFEISVIR